MELEIIHFSQLHITRFHVWDLQTSYMKFLHLLPCWTNSILEFMSLVWSILNYTGLYRIFQQKINKIDCEPLTTFHVLEFFFCHCTFSQFYFGSVFHFRFTSFQKLLSDTFSLPSLFCQTYYFIVLPQFQMSFYPFFHRSPFSTSFSR